MRRYSVVLAIALALTIVCVSVAAAATEPDATAPATLGFSVPPPGLSVADWAGISEQIGADLVAAADFTSATQQAYLKASNAQQQDLFGWSVAVSGDTVVVGAYGEDSNATGVNGTQTSNDTENSGAVYVFVRNGATWSQQAYLKASNPDVIDYFGYSVAISGDTVVVGAYGEDGNGTGVGGNQADNSADGSGAVYVFVRNGTTWSQQAYLKASNTDPDDYFGYSVAVSGDTAAVGAFGENSNATGVNGDEANDSTNDAGAVYIFTRSGTTWSQQAYLKASNTGVNDQFGTWVAVSGDTVVVGAPQESSSAAGVNGNQADNSLAQAGAAYVFVRSGTTWSQQAYLKASNPGYADLFGHRVAVSGNTVLVGAPYEDSNATGVNGTQSDESKQNAGAAYVFTRSGTTWSQQAYLKASSSDAGDYFGVAVGLSDDTAVVGAGHERSNATGINGDQADNSAPYAGAAYVFTRSGITWSQQAYLKASNTESNDYFADSVAVSDNTVVVGAYIESSGASGVNGDQGDNSAYAAGAAYVYVGGATTGSATGRGAYLPSASSNKTATFNFSVTSTTNSGSGSEVDLAGTLNWSWGGKWVLASSSITGFVATVVPGYAWARTIKGTGLLREVGRWGYISSRQVTFIAVVCDGGMKTVGRRTTALPDAFGIDIPAADPPGESEPVKLKSGSVVIEAR